MPKNLLFPILLVLCLVKSVYPMSVNEAANQALRDNPDLQALRLEKEIIRGQLEKAKLPLTSNPVIESNLSGKDKPQEEGGGKYTNYGFTLSQEFEIAGQRGLRIDIAEKDLSRLSLDIRDRERVLTFEVKEAFTRILAAKKKRN